jgi:proteic killer suppression protein
MVIKSFANEGTHDIYHGINSKKARKILDPLLCRNARNKLDMINASNSVNDLRVPPANHLEALSGNLKGKFSIRINDQYRIIFNWTDQGAEELETTDYH